MLKSKLQYILHPSRILYRLAYKGLLPMDDRKYLEYMFEERLGYKLNLDAPKTFNEKIQWLKLNDRNPMYTDFVDKYEVKKYVKSILGEEYVIPTIGVFRGAEIDFEKMPEQFVLKCTHDSGGIVIVTDKKKFDIEGTKRKLNKLLKRNYFYQGREWPYLNIKARVIAEPYIADCNHELYDYKFMVFNGKVRCTFVCSERFSAEGLKVTFFDENWKVLPFERHYRRSNNPIPKPTNYELMVELAEKLAKGIRFVRVDFYEVNGNVYFGEMTFYPGSGFEEFTPQEWDFKMGDWLEL